MGRLAVSAFRESKNENLSDQPRGGGPKVPQDTTEPDRRRRKVSDRRASGDLSRQDEKKIPNTPVPHRQCSHPVGRSHLCFGYIGRGGRVARVNQKFCRTCFRRSYGIGPSGEHSARCRDFSGHFGRHP